MLRLSLAAALALVLAAPAAAQWPTTEWSILEDQAGGYEEPEGRAQNRRVEVVLL